MRPLRDSRSRGRPGRQAPEKGHIPVLDGVRAVAVLIVICFHDWPAVGPERYSLIGKLAVWGQTGVDLFFVLSGFLITGILLDSKGSEHFLRNFYVRRILRIFPLYYMTLFALYVLCPLLRVSAWVPLKQSFWFWVYLQNIPMTFAPSAITGPGHFWSLAVEEHYYFFWPFLVMVFDRKKLLRVVALAIAASLLTRIVFFHDKTFYFTLARLDGLAVGSALAIFARDGTGGLARFVPWAKGLFCGLGLMLAASQLTLSGSRLPAVQVVKSTLVAVVYACVMVLAIENRLGRIPAKMLNGRILGSVGKYSYGMYVFHPFVISLLSWAGIRGGVPGLAAGVLLTYAAAWASWMLVEKRFLRLKRYFEYGSGRRVPRLAAAQP